MNKRLLPLLLAVTFIAINVNAQLMLGVATSSYSRSNSMYLNPANIADSQDKITISIIGIGITADNNLGTINSIGSISNSLNSSNATFSDIFTNSGRQNFSMMIPAVNIHGPSIIYSINKKNSIAITTGLRVMNQFNNFNQSLYNTIINTSAISNGNYSYSAQKFNWTANMWNEIGISYGGVIIDEPASQLKVGITLRRLGGIGYVALKGNNLDIHYSAGADSFYSSHSDIEFASSVITDNNAVFNGVNTSNLLNSFLGGSAGSGIGADMGVVYSHRFGNPDPIDYMESNITHTIVLSAAVKDIGAIRYNQDNNAIINVSGNGYLTGQGLSSNVTDVTSFKNYMAQQGFSADTAAAATKVHMPTTLILSADYELRYRIYLNATFMANLANRQNFGNSYYDQLTITPRYDFRLITVALPITYSWLARDLKVGFAFRISGFFIGSDDLLAVLASHQYGFNAYCGGYIPIKYPKKKKSLTQHDHYERFVQ